MIANFPSETLQDRDIMLSERTQNVIRCMIPKKKSFGGTNQYVIARSQGEGAENDCKGA